MDRRTFSATLATLPFFPAATLDQDQEDQVFWKSIERVINFASQGPTSFFIFLDDVNVTSLTYGHAGHTKHNRVRVLQLPTDYERLIGPRTDFWKALHAEAAQRRIASLDAKGRYFVSGEAVDFAISNPGVYFNWVEVHDNLKGWTATLKGDVVKEWFFTKAEFLRIYPHKRFWAYPEVPKSLAVSWQRRGYLEMPFG